MTEEERPGRRARSLHCKPEEQALIRERAAAAGKTVSGYVLDLALADDPERHQLVLTADEQTDLRDAVAELRAFVLALMIEIPKTGGLSLLAAIAVLGEAGTVAARHRRGRLAATVAFRDDAPLLRLAPPPPPGQFHPRQLRLQPLRSIRHLRPCLFDSWTHHPGAQSRSHTFAQSSRVAKAILTGCIPSRGHRAAFRSPAAHPAGSPSTPRRARFHVR